MPALFTGVSNGVIEEVASYPQLVQLGYDVATNEKVRTGLWEAIKGISVESIKNGAANFYEKQKEIYTNGKPHIVNHHLGKDAVAIASLFMGGGAKKGLKEATNNLDDGIKRVGKEVKEKTTELVGKYDWNLVRKYFKHIQDVTGKEVHQKQIEKLKEALREKEYKKLSPSDVKKHRSKFTTSVKNKCIEKWEHETGQIWPRYTEIIYDKNGDVYKKIGDPYDAHHIIENQFEGPHEWWNIHPAKFPDEHQTLIHGKDSPARELFK